MTLIAVSVQLTLVRNGMTAWVPRQRPTMGQRKK